VTEGTNRARGGVGLLGRALAPAALLAAGAGPLRAQTAAAPAFTVGDTMVRQGRFAAIAPSRDTIVSTYPDGRKAELWMNPDGSFTSMGRRHDRHAGHWSVKGDKVCFKRGLFGYCTVMPTDTAFRVTVMVISPGRLASSNLSV